MHDRGGEPSCDFEDFGVECGVRCKARQLRFFSCYWPQPNRNSSIYGLVAAKIIPIGGLYRVREISEG